MNLVFFLFSLAKNSLKLFNHSKKEAIMSLIKRESNLPTWSNFFGDFLNRDWNDWSNQHYSLTNTTLPSVNIKETEDDFFVQMAAPGMVKDDFKIELTNNLLTISSEKQSENQFKDKERITRCEFSYQSFSRSFVLPAIVDNERIEAKYENGILSIAIPKKEEAKPKPTRKIMVS
jgi:HSP20 family protein